MCEADTSWEVCICFDSIAAAAVWIYVSMRRHNCPTHSWYCAFVYRRSIKRLAVLDRHWLVISILYYHPNIYSQNNHTSFFRCSIKHLEMKQSVIWFFIVFYQVCQILIFAFRFFHTTAIVLRKHKWEHLKETQFDTNTDFLYSP